MDRNANTESEDYLYGTWIIDSTNRILEMEEHPTIRIMEFNKENKGTNHLYSFRHNKIYKNNFENYKVTNTSFSFHLEDENSYPPNWDKYKLVKMSENNFKLIAKFATTNWTFPERDSIIYYSRITNVKDYLTPFLKKGKATNLNCESPEIKYLQGYWKEDSVEHVNYTSYEEYSYKYIDTLGTYGRLFLGNKTYVEQDKIRIVGNKIVFDDGIMTITCLSQNRFVSENNTESYYKATYYSKINPDDIIPDSLRLDKK